MTCNHKTSDVTDTRPRDFIGKGGKPKYKITDIPFYIVRRRKCCDCGDKFTTVEVDAEYIAKLKANEKTLESLKVFLHGRV